MSGSYPGVVQMTLELMPTEVLLVTVIVRSRSHSLLIVM